VTEPTYDEMLEDQINSAKEKLGEGDIKSLLNAGDTWIVD
jgi:2-oxoglutarate ferredoxin oxidoreductase subunit beta